MVIISAHQFEALGFPASFPLRELHGAGKVAARQETEAAAEAGSCHRRGAAGTKVRVAIGGGGRRTGGTTASPAGGCAPGAKLSPRAAPPSRCLRRPLGAPSCRLALSRTQPAAAQLSAGIPICESTALICESNTPYPPQVLKTPSCHPGWEESVF